MTMGAVWAIASPSPDLIVTGDGRHLAARMPSGELAGLRDRAGDYTRAMLAENGGLDGEPALLSDQRDARCSRDLCVVDLGRAGRRWRVVATRSADLVPYRELIAMCASADIVVSERRLPEACAPHWLRLDRSVLQRTGGVTIGLGGRHGARPWVRTVASAGDAHPWRHPSGVRPVKPRSSAPSRTGPAFR